MVSLKIFLVATLSGIGYAQHGARIPEVQSYASCAVSKFRQYTHYAGPAHTNHPEAVPANHENHAVPTHVHHQKPRATAACSTYWLENMKHQGVAAFNSAPSTYKVFRNVKDYGAKGDGKTDDTAAIQKAISDGNRCAPGACNSTTVTPAIVYFPAGTYLTTTSIINYYYTQLVGNALCPPTIKAAANWANGFGIIDGDPYGANGLEFGSTNTFYRQIRNFILDMTAVPASSSMTGIHWPTAQATSLQNIVFQMSSAKGTQHQGLFIEEGSGGFMNDLTFYGGFIAMNVGNQQFTFRNINIYNAVTAINQLWSWGWTYKNININNCSIGLNMTNGGHNNQQVGSITLLDSSITNTPIGVLTVHDSTSLPQTGGSLILENVALSNVKTAAVMGPNNTVALAGTTGSTKIAAWGEGHSYIPAGPTVFEGAITASTRPASLLQADGKYYERSKPQYETLPSTSFISARSSGAKGDGTTDDTLALQNAITLAAATGKILFLDHGDYIVTKTLYIPAGSKIVGEAYSVILSRGTYFNTMSAPQAVVQVGKSGEKGSVELSDFIVSTQGQQQGAILIEVNLVAPAGTPSGLWDVHLRIGGFAGSQLQLAQCPTTPKSTTINTKCIAAFMGMHVTKGAAGLYMENNWLWTADHDIEDHLETRVTIYTGRGLLIESTNGPTWLVGTAVEHFARYQYQLVATKNIWMGQIQTETAYYQPNPNAMQPFPVNSAYNDPVFPSGGAVGNSINVSEGWGLRLLNSSALIYGAGLYSFFNNYSTTCSDQGNGETCQTRIFSIEGTSTVNLYNLNTVGATKMITISGIDDATYSYNPNGFISTIAWFHTK